MVSPFSGHSTEPERLQVVRDGFAWGVGGQGGVRGSLSERDEDTAILLLTMPTNIETQLLDQQMVLSGEIFSRPLGVNLEL